MIYLIDHEDSFTYNLAHLLDSIEPTIVSNYYEINYKKLRKASTIVLSPGPGEPKDYPLTSEIYKKYKAIDDGTIIFDYDKNDPSNFVKQSIVIVPLDSKKILSEESNCKIYHGTSQDHLEQILTEIEDGSSVNFWLDGHWSGGDTFKGDTDTPRLFLFVQQTTNVVSIDTAFVYKDQSLYMFLGNFIVLYVFFL